MRCFLGDELGSEDSNLVTILLEGVRRHECVCYYHQLEVIIVSKAKHKTVGITVKRGDSVQFRHLEALRESLCLVNRSGVSVVNTKLRGRLILVGF